MLINNNNLSVCYFGSYDPRYSRNRVILKGLRENNLNLVECNTAEGGLRKYISLIRQHSAIKNKYDIIIVAYSDCRPLVLLARILSLRKKLIWDAYYSLYDSWVFDRKLVNPRSFKAFYYYFIELAACFCADYVLVDTKAYIKYFSEVFRISPTKLVEVPVGSDDDVMKPMPKLNKKENVFSVLFYGNFVPLQGIEYIIGAAELLKNGHCDVEFNIIGNGQTFDKIRKMVIEHDVFSVKFLPAVEYSELPEYINGADACLGIFGDSGKANRVLPNKVYEALACARPIITRKSAATDEFLIDRENVILCNAADAKDLADKILELKNDKPLAKKIAENGHKLFLDNFKPSITIKDLMKVIK